MSSPQDKNRIKKFLHSAVNTMGDKHEINGITSSLEHLNYIINLLEIQFRGDLLMSYIELELGRYAFHRDNFEMIQKL